MYTPFFEKGKKIENIDDIKLIHVENLLINEIGEGYFLDYKRELTKDISKDISAFANTMGGWLIIGISEKDNGIAGKIMGIKGKSIHDTIQQMIITNIEPIPKFEIKNIDIKDDKYISIVKIYEGNDTPYIHIKTGKIYIRQGEGKKPIKTDSLNNRYELDKLIHKGDKEKLFIEEKLKLGFDEDIYFPFFIFNGIFEPLNFFKFDNFYSESFLNKIKEGFKKINIGLDKNITVDCKINNIQVVGDCYNLEFSIDKSLKPKIILKIYRNGYFTIFLPINNNTINFSNLGYIKEDNIFDTFKSLLYKNYYPEFDEINYLDIFELMLNFHIYFNGIIGLLLGDKNFKENLFQFKYSIKLGNIPGDSIIFYNGKKSIENIKEKGFLKTGFIIKKIPLVFNEKFIPFKLNEEGQNYLFIQIIKMFGDYSFDSEDIIGDFIRFMLNAGKNKK